MTLAISELALNASRRTAVKREGAAGLFAKVVLFMSVTIIGLIVVVAVFAPWLAPHSPIALHLLNAYAGPSRRYLLGQDGAGRDVLSRLMYGARLSLLGPTIVVVMAVTTGVPLGLMAAYSGGWIDGIVSRVFDLIFGFPSLLLAIVIVATFGASFYTAVFAVGITYIPLMGRVVRSAGLVERHKSYVEACRVQGYGAIRVIGVHIAPSIARVVITQTTLYFAYALLDLAALSFLGLGVQAPQIDWGGMLENANQGVFESPTGVIAPAVAIVLLVVSLNLFADWFADRASGSQ